MTGGMMFKGTPGPWLDWSNMEWIYEPKKLLTNTEDSLLIAAAPELLEALQLFVAEYVDLVESGDAGFWNAEEESKVIKARAVIAKALGEQK